MIQMECLHKPQSPVRACAISSSMSSCLAFQPGTDQETLPGQSPQETWGPVPCREQACLREAAG